MTASRPVGGVVKIFSTLWVGMVLICLPATAHESIEANTFHGPSLMIVGGVVTAIGVIMLGPDRADRCSVGKRGQQSEAECLAEQKREEAQYRRVGQVLWPLGLTGFAYGWHLYSSEERNVEIKVNSESVGVTVQTRF